MQPDYNLLHYAEAASTNSLLASMVTDMPHATVVSAHAQTAGRGQRGNHWEAAPGLNITLSALFRPVSLHARSQFVISEIVALAVVQTVNRFLHGVCSAQVKWPNDIYVDNRKICGILIENSLCGNNVAYSIAGIGLNVNQQQFLSDAPNPVSMRQLAGHDLPLEEVERYMCSSLFSLYDRFIVAPRHAALHGAYMQLLWRSDGYYRFHDMLRGEDITARIAGVAPTGHLTLLLDTGEKRIYAFKEVAFL